MTKSEQRYRDAEGNMTLCNWETEREALAGKASGQTFCSNDESYTAGWLAAAKLIETVIRSHVPAPLSYATNANAAADLILAQQAEIAALKVDAKRLNRILIVDVQLEPATTIHAGCRIKTVVSGLSANYRSREPDQI